MKKKDLIREIRSQWGMVQDRIIAHMTDDDVLDLLTKCNCCDDRIVKKSDLPAIIEKAKNAKEFLALVSPYWQVS